GHRGREDEPGAAPAAQRLEQRAHPVDVHAQGEVEVELRARGDDRGEVEDGHAVAVDEVRDVCDVAGHALDARVVEALRLHYVDKHQPLELRTPEEDATGTRAAE